MPIIDKFPKNISLEKGTLFFGALSALLFLMSEILIENHNTKTINSYTWTYQPIQGMSLSGVIHTFLLFIGVIGKWRFVLITYLLANFIIVIMEINDKSWFYKHSQGFTSWFSLVAVVVHLVLEVLIWIGTIALFQKYHEEARRLKAAAPKTGTAPATTL